MFKLRVLSSWLETATDYREWTGVRKNKKARQKPVMMAINTCGDSFKCSKTEKGSKPTAAMLLIKVNYKLQMKWKRAKSK
jgi:hypothetical protein